MSEARDEQEMTPIDPDTADRNDGGAMGKADGVQRINGDTQADDAAPSHVADGVVSGAAASENAGAAVAVAMEEEPDVQEEVEEPYTDEETAELRNIVESLVFASDEPIAAKFIRQIIEDVNKDRVEGNRIRATTEGIKRAVAAINRTYADRAFHIIPIAGGFTFATKPKYSAFVGKLAKEKARRKLSATAIETLAIIAYKQPITKSEIEFIRGVNADYIIKTLLEKNLISITGRASTPGRPLLYGTTDHFLMHFGLNEITDLPKPREIEELIGETELEVEKRMLAEQQELEFKEELSQKMDGGAPKAKSNGARAPLRQPSGSTVVRTDEPPVPTPPSEMPAEPSAETPTDVSAEPAAATPTEVNADSVAAVPAEIAAEPAETLPAPPETAEESNAEAMPVLEAETVELTADASPLHEAETAELKGEPMPELEADTEETAAEAMPIADEPAAESDGEQWDVPAEPVMEAPAVEESAVEESIAGEPPVAEPEPELHTPPEAPASEEAEAVIVVEPEEPVPSDEVFDADAAVAVGEPVSAVEEPEVPLDDETVPSTPAIETVEEEVTETAATEALEASETEAAAAAETLEASETEAATAIGTVEEQPSETAVTEEQAVHEEHDGASAQEAQADTGEQHAHEKGWSKWKTKIKTFFKKLFE